MVIDIIDASNLERSLYLATQLRELDSKVLFALEHGRSGPCPGNKIDADKLSDCSMCRLYLPSETKTQGIDNLLQTAIELAVSGSEAPRKRRVKYNKDIEAAIAELQDALRSRLTVPLPYDIRWTAIKLLENDQIVRTRLLKTADPAGLQILDRYEAPPAGN